MKGKKGFEKKYGVGMGKKRNTIIGSIGLQKFRFIRTLLGHECYFRQINHPLLHLQYQGYGDLGSEWWCKELDKTFYNNWIYGLIEIKGLEEKEQ